MSKKLDSIRQRMKDHWGFDVWRNQPNELPRWAGAWNTGYTVFGNLRGTFYEWHPSLASIERRFLKDVPARDRGDSVR